jgi:hypothetical protein
MAALAANRRASPGGHSALHTVALDSFAGVVLFVTILGCGGASSGQGTAGQDPPSQATDHDPETESGSTPTPRSVRTPEAKESEEAEADANVLARLQRAAWWNEPSIAGSLALSAELRSALDQLLAEQLMARRTAERERREAERELPIALLGGDQERAGQLRGVLSEAVRRSTDAEVVLRVRGFALLDPQQRRRIGEQYPHLAEKPWIGALRPRAVSRSSDVR